MKTEMTEPDWFRIVWEAELHNCRELYLPRASGAYRERLLARIAEAERQIAAMGADHAHH